MKKSFFVSIITGLGASIIVGYLTYRITVNKDKKIIEACDKKVQKFKQYYQLTNQWIQNKNDKKNITDYLLRNGLYKIAIYGMGELGNKLFEEIDHSKIEVKYIIDRYPESNFANVKFVELNNNIEPVDAIIVTPIFDYEQIEQEISEFVDYKVISLEEILYNV